MHTQSLPAIGLPTEHAADYVSLTSWTSMSAGTVSHAMQTNNHRVKNFIFRKPPPQPRVGHVNLDLSLLPVRPSQFLGPDNLQHYYKTLHGPKADPVELNLWTVIPMSTTARAMLDPEADRVDEQTDTAGLY
jgi:hypothetical protein